MPDKNNRNRPNPYRWSLRARKPRAAPKRSADDRQRAPEPSQVDTARSQSDNIADNGSGAEREPSQTASSIRPSVPSSSSSSSSGTTPSDRVISGQRENASEQAGEQQAERYPLRHLSVRVPWHDNGWNGTVCQAPHLNGACTKITRIGRAKNEEREQEIAGESYKNLLRGQVPYCFRENSAFMAEFPMDFNLRHDQADWLGFLPVKLNVPPYSLIVKPFRWLKKNSVEEFNKNFRLDLDGSREEYPDFDSPWLNNADNIEKILGAFKAHLKPQNSLCFIYATHVPFIEREEKVLIGVGRISGDLPDLTVYEPRKDGPEGRVWEMPIQHSIRPNGSDGFLLPYHKILDIAEKHPEFEIEVESYSATISPELDKEFSNGSELVSNDGAIAALVALDDSLTKIEQNPLICQNLDFDVQRHRRWIGIELARLGTIRGSFPGLGSVLQAIEITKGLPVAIELQGKIGENEDPWPKVAEAFQDPSILPKDLRTSIDDGKKLWNTLTPERRNLLKLLSQFEINEKQARAVINKGLKYASGEKVEDAAILWNPYIIYEAGRREKDSIPLLTIDRGVIPIQSKDESASITIGLNSELDPRRIKAFAISALEDAASDGHTVQSLSELAERVKKISGYQKCPVSPDILSTVATMMQPEVLKVQNILDENHSDETYIQLKRYHDYGKLIRDQILGTLNRRLNLKINWAERLATEFGEAEENEETRAQLEKEAALNEIANSQLSVLIGPAGTGKTTLLKILCSEAEIRRRNILLLAPTGKAAVRMEELAGGTARAMTVAKFLLNSKRYDSELQIYQLNDNHPHQYGTVIVDEASMLTEDMLAALFDSVKDVDRFILIGDPSQLPPIGAGKPFVDIVNELRPLNANSVFPRVGAGYAELTVERRQRGDDTTARRLADWFSSFTPKSDDDSIFTHAIQDSSSIRFVEWHRSDDFRKKFLEILVEELKLTGKEDAKGFNRKALGARPSNREFDEFIPTGDSRQGSVAMIDKWQVLSPLKGMPFGKNDINNQIHKTFRLEYIRNANKSPITRLIPRPYGTEQIVYGDKVINLRNDRVQDVYPVEGAQQYIANGEIGVVVGHLKEEDDDPPPNIIQVEFSSQLGYIYDFDPIREQVPLELAYALTVHKAQGSQFDLVILVLPKEHRIMSRELIYTALTRHRRRVVVMHQGSLVHLKELTEPHRSEIARRRTNLFGESKMSEVRRERGSVFLEDRLIHRTGNGLAVRSKSELLIAEALENKNVPFRYEKPLQRGGKTYFPDFTISDERTGRTVYWEHLGMLDDENYVRSWNRKLSWYRANGILPYEENKNGNAVLVTTQDSPQSGLDMAEVRRLIEEVCVG